jgi:hypothetical protein
MEQPRAVAGVGAVVCLLTVVLVWWLVTVWGPLGAAVGFLCGNAAGSLGLWPAFLALVREHGSKGGSFPAPCDLDRVPAVRAIRQFTQDPKDVGWVIKELEHGDQANIGTAERCPGQARPLQRPCAWSLNRFQPHAKRSLACSARLTNLGSSGPKWKTFS